MDDTQFPSTYDPARYEDGVYAAWEKSGFFNPDKLPGERKDPFTIMLPPPNVTGTLHMGHAVMLAVEDVLTRAARMQGKKALWLPGTDHAAIATQSKVEGILTQEEGKTRHDLGREVFLDRVRAFASDSHDTIVNQVKKMGASVDWSREAYTLDAARNRAVNEAFKRMYEDGLIYRGFRIVNWDPIGKTTVSDDELVYEERNAVLYTFVYAKECPIPISTTRPETKVGDTAIAVHPEGKWKEYIGRTFEVSFVGVPLTLKVVGDAVVDEAFGTGALGVTPAHSAIDAEIAKRHGLPTVQVINEDATMMTAAGSFAGQTVLEARKAIIAKLREAELITNEEQIRQNVATAERSGGVIEPMPKLQWFIDVNKPFTMRASKLDGIKTGDQVTLKQLMQTVVKNGQIKILPERFNKTYFHWIDNLRDWNISRQIWFGHRVPVWYKGAEMTVGNAPIEEGWVQDEDTLDTWFSSGLWTFSTLGWPDETVDFKTFHPTTVLETGYDILFFWVARMILMTTYLIGDIPFKDVYLHGLVRDEKGRKMSKSLGNIIDPLDMIAKYGADATRLSLLIGSTPGNDTKLNEEKIAGYKHFTNKLWNISRFVLTTVGEGVGGGMQEAGGEIPKPATRADAWILSRLSQTRDVVTQHLAAYDISAAGEAMREFTWSEFADWYVEIAKVQRAQGKGTSTDAVLLYALDMLMRLWHPFMPFVTEVIWQMMGKRDLIVAPWPEAFSVSASKEFDQVMEVISATRRLRALYRIAPAQKISITLYAKDASIFEEESSVIQTLGRLESFSCVTQPQTRKGMVCEMAGPIAVYMDLRGLVDLDAERVRLEQEIAQTRTYLVSTSKRLSNQEFVNNAPEEIVSELRQKVADAQTKIALLEAHIASLS